MCLFSSTSTAVCLCRVRATIDKHMTLYAAFFTFQNRALLYIVFPCGILSFAINPLGLDTNEMKIDSAVIKALSLDPAKTAVAKHGGSGFSTTAKITTTLKDGTEKRLFMKTGKGKDAEVMFAGEHASLNAIHNIPSLCPASFAHGPLEDTTGGAFLVTDYLDMSGTSLESEKGSGMSLAAKLAKLHTTAAPIPEGFSKPVFGFPVPSK